MTQTRPASDRPDWSRLKAHWPNSASSAFIQAAGVVWHIQRAGPKNTQPVLLIHGTGASSHSFSALLPLLAHDHDVLALDLPGHGFTASVPPSKLSLPGMAEAVKQLLDHERFTPAIAIGHSAGAAILLEMATGPSATPFELIIGLNAALKPIEGNAIFAPLAKVLFVNPLTPRLFALQARHTNVSSSMIKATNSPIDEKSRSPYRTLMENSAHVNGALGMMANWDLRPLIAKLPSIKTEVQLIVAKDDPMVPPSVSRDAAARLPNATLIDHESGGHLLHEINPSIILDTIAAFNDTQQSELAQTQMTGS